MADPGGARTGFSNRVKRAGNTARLNSSVVIRPYGTLCREACAQALSYWETALGFVAGFPGFPAYVLVAFGLNGEPLPLLVLALAPIDGKLVGPQLARTFEPVCPGAAVAAPGLVLGLGTSL